MSEAGPQSIAEVCTTSGDQEPPARGLGFTRVAPRRDAARRPAARARPATPLDLDLDASRAGRAAAGCRPRRPVERELDPDASVAQLARRRARPCARTLPYWVHGKPSRRRRAGCPGRTRPRALAGAELGDERHLADGDDGAQPLAGGDHRPRRRSAGLGDAPGDGGAQRAARHLVLQALHLRELGLLLALERQELAAHVLQAREPVTRGHEAIAIQALDGEPLGLGGAGQPLHVGLGERALLVADEAAVGEVLHALEGVARLPRGGLRLGGVGAGLVERDERATALGVARVAVRRELLAPGRNLRRERREGDPRLGQLEAHAGGVELGQHVARGHLASEDRLVAYHRPADVRGHRVGARTHLQTRGRAADVDADPRQPRPGEPRGEERDRQQRGQRRSGGAIGVQRAQRA